MVGNSDLERGRLTRSAAVTGLLLLLVVGGVLPASASTARAVPAVPSPGVASAVPYAEVNYTLHAPVAAAADGVAFDPDNGSFYSVGRNNEVTVVNESTWKATANITVSAGDYAMIAIDPVHDLGFVTGGAVGALTLFNASTLRVLRTIGTSGGSGIAVDPTHEWVMFSNGYTISILDYASWTYRANLTLPAGETPGRFGYDPAQELLSFAYQGPSAVGIVNVSTCRWVTNQTTPSYSVASAYDPASRSFVVAEASNVSLISTAPPYAIRNYTLPGPGSDANAVTVANGGADEALLWEYANGGGAQLQPFDIARGTFPPAVVYRPSGAWPAAITIDPRTLVAVGVDPNSASDVPYLPVWNRSYPVTLSETGLPSGTNWCATLGSTTSCTAAQALAFHEPNGTYTFTVATASGYTPSPAAGTLTVAGSAIGQAIVYAGPAEARYYVNFTESGLPAGTSWSVTLNWMNQSSTSSTISFSMLNGVYGYSVNPVGGYVSNPVSGFENVSGAPVNQLVSFTSTPTPHYPVTFTENGLPSGTLWSVTLGGVGSSSTSPQIAYNETNGTYVYTVGTVAGYTATPTSGSVTVKGGGVPVPISFTPVGRKVYNVTFNESGLPASTTWAVTLNGTTLTSALTSIVFAEPAGNYTFSVPSAGGYSPTPSSGTLPVGAPTYVTVIFTKVPGRYYVTFTESGLTAGTSWSVTFNGTAYPSTTTTIVPPSVRNGSYAFSVAAVTGYTVSPASGAVNVTGLNVSQAIHFTSTSAATYSVDFYEAGLPAGITWSLNFVGVPYTGPTPYGIGFTEPNGTYTFQVPVDSGFSPTPSSGNVTVNGSSVVRTIVFSKVTTYTLTFTEQGLPTGSAWGVAIQSWSNRTNSVTSSIVLNESNGTYTYYVTNLSSYVASPYTGQVTMAGTAQTVAVTFTEVFVVSFRQSGLPASQSWSVTLGGVTKAITGGLLTYIEPNGSYDFVVGSLSGYSVDHPSGTVSVYGNPSTVHLNFTANSTSVTPNPWSLSTTGGTLFDLLWIAGIVAVGVVAVLISRPRRAQPRAY